MTNEIDKILNERIDYLMGGGRDLIEFFQNLEEPYQSYVSFILEEEDENGISVISLLEDALSGGKTYIGNDDLGYYAKMPSGRIVNKPFIDMHSDLHIFVITPQYEDEPGSYLENELIIKNYPNHNIPSEKYWEISLRGARYITPQTRYLSSSNLPRLILRRSGDGALGEVITVHREQNVLDIYGIMHTSTVTTEDRVRVKAKSE